MELLALTRSVGENTKRIARAASEWNHFIKSGRNIFGGKQKNLKIFLDGFWMQSYSCAR
jgi:hypothetical protein